MKTLTASLPETVTVGGRPVRINTDFRAGIRFEMMVLDEKITAEQMLSNYYGDDWPQPYDEAIRAAIWFYQCGNEQKPESECERKLKKNKRGYDFEVDADAIYTSFWQAYQIDLQSENLHWWAFRALLMGLPENTPFMQRVYYRVGSTDRMNQKQKKHFESMRRKYALPERGSIDRKLTLEERDAAMKQYVSELFKKNEKN